MTFGGQVLRSAEDLQLSDGEIDELLSEHGNGRSPFDASSADSSPSVQRQASALSFDELREVLISGRYRQIESGRFFILLSLQEAETIRVRRPPTPFPAQHSDPSRPPKPPFPFVVPRPLSPARAVHLPPQDP